MRENLNPQTLSASAVTLDSRRPRWSALLLAAAALAILAPDVVWSAGSALPGERVRNAFGPLSGDRAPRCRGACGLGCPSSCSEETAYECQGADALTRVVTYQCGTHQGCREHDDCLDACSQRAAQGIDCDAQCHVDAVSRYGLEMAGSWAGGGGPFEGAPILFEYTRLAPNAPDPAYRCPEGSSRQCAGEVGRCVDGGGRTLEPVFDSYPAPAGGMRISGFRSGRVCVGAEGPTGVCETAIEIRANGEDLCQRDGSEQPCTWYGFELDYENADPSQPLLCATSGGNGGSGDFLGNVVSGAIRAAPRQEGTQLGALLGQLQGALETGSLEEALSGITVRPHGQPAAPAPEEPAGPPPGVPRSVELAGASGHLLVPIYELDPGAAGSGVVVREVRCTHNGAPVLETTYRLRFGGE